MLKRQVLLNQLAGYHLLALLVIFLLCETFDVWLGSDFLHGAPEMANWPLGKWKGSRKKAGPLCRWPEQMRCVRVSSVPTIAQPSQRGHALVFLATPPARTCLTGVTSRLIRRPLGIRQKQVKDVMGIIPAATMGLLSVGGGGCMKKCHFLEECVPNCHRRMIQPRRQ